MGIPYDVIRMYTCVRVRAYTCVWGAPPCHPPPPSTHPPTPPEGGPPEPVKIQ